MWRNRAALPALLVGLSIGWMAGRAPAQGTPLPQGKNVEIVVGRCIICHSLEMVAMQRLDRERWEAVVDRMIDYGAPISPQDKQTILDYLATHLGP
jgi:hypothetical protein